MVHYLFFFFFNFQIMLHISQTQFESVVIKTCPLTMKINIEHRIIYTFLPIADTFFFSLFSLAFSFYFGDISAFHNLNSFFFIELMCSSENKYFLMKIYTQIYNFIQRFFKWISGLHSKLLPVHLHLVPYQ